MFVEVLMARKKHRQKSHQENHKREETKREEKAKSEGSYFQKGCDFVGQSIKNYLTKENIIIAGGEAFNYLMLTIDPYQRDVSDFATQAKKIIHTGSALESMVQSKGINVDNIPGYHAGNTFILNSQMVYSEVIDDCLGLDVIQNQNKLMGQMITATAINAASRVPMMIANIGQNITSSIRFWSYGNNSTEKADQVPLKPSAEVKPEVAKRADGSEKFKDFKDKYNLQKKDEEELASEVSVKMSSPG